jgi:hypothetical protein
MKLVSCGYISGYEDMCGISETLSESSRSPRARVMEPDIPEGSEK